MAFRPITILKDLAMKAWFAGSECIHDNPPCKKIQKCLKNNEPIPDELLPGRTIMALPEDERKLLQELKSDDIKDDRLV